MKRINKAKRLVCQPQFRQRVVRDRSKYTRKNKHKKAPDSGGFVLCLLVQE
jgi:stalled ribosome alternative rescue factor ArfA